MKSQILGYAGPLLAVLSVVVLVVSVSAARAGDEAFPVIPRPERIRPAEGSFFLAGAGIRVRPAGANELKPLADFLAIAMEEAGTMKPGGKRPGAATGGTIVLRLDESLSRLGDEGYRLRISPSSATLAAPKSAGVFYGIQTLRQLAAGRDRLPCGEIIDRPAFAWRGLLLDCCRHFMSVGLVKKYIDLLAYHKMNVFHWHLTEDQGWRLEIKRYPRLTEVGAWRMEHGKKYGGFYTQAEVREVVAYAAERHVAVVPEIEMPGHAAAALAAYPEYGCQGRPLPVPPDYGVFRDVFCPGKDGTIAFLENVLAEVCDLFPSPYIHIGGDECPKDHWRACPDCRRRIREEGLKDEAELQGWFTRRMEEFLRSRGRKMIGWDEILEGGVTRTAVVQSWRGMAGAAAAARLGNPVISSPWDPVYLLCPQVPEEVRSNFTTLNSLDKVYAFDPAPPAPESGRPATVMGGEGCLWSEWTFEFEVDAQVFPRLCALAEALWTPSARRDFDDFGRRLDAHRPRLAALGVDFHRPETRAGEWRPDDVDATFNLLAFDLTPHVARDGIYRIGLVQTAGDDTLVFQSAVLFRNGAEIARHDKIHRSQLDMYVRYPLRVAGHKAGDVYTLRVSVATATGKKNESPGAVWLRFFDDSGIDIR